MMNSYHQEFVYKIATKLCVNPRYKLFVLNFGEVCVFPWQ
jgi:hypothetical protein